MKRILEPGSDKPGSGICLDTHHSSYITFLLLHCHGNCWAKQLMSLKRLRPDEFESCSWRNEAASSKPAQKLHKFSDFHQGFQVYFSPKYKSCNLLKYFKPWQKQEWKELLVHDNGSCSPTSTNRSYMISVCVCVCVMHLCLVLSGYWYFLPERWQLYQRWPSHWGVSISAGKGKSNPVRGVITACTCTPAIPLAI